MTGGDRTTLLVIIEDVAELALTAERRSELIDLPGDDDRLRAEYPTVSEYLEMSPQLAGTGNVQVDAAFELRIVHYMTCDRSESPNPYWDIVSPFVSERDGGRVIDGGKEDGRPRLAFAQMLLQAVYAYALPAPETLDWMATFCGGRKIVELGAGRATGQRSWLGPVRRSRSTTSSRPTRRRTSRFRVLLGRLTRGIRSVTLASST